LDSKDTAVITLRVPIAWKRALGQVAAAQDTTMTELLRVQVHEIITSYRGGIFFDLNVRKDGQVRSGKDNEARR
jgi:hypothetical protein